MSKYLTILCIGITLFCSKLCYSGEIIVSSLENSGEGTLRDGLSVAASGDTVFINVKGIIELDSPIELIGKSDLTIIGPFPKHLSISPAAGCTGDLIHVNNCTNITFLGIGFIDGNGSTRHIRVSNSSSSILFERCLFDDNAVALNGAAAEVSNAIVHFLSCSFTDNSGIFGGAIYLTSGANTIIENCSFIDNSASSGAGAIYISNGAHVDIRFTSIFNNSAGANPQAIGTTSGTTLTMENVAVANNGGLLVKQLDLDGTVISYGGNCIQLNLLTELTDMPPPEDGDYTSFLVFNTGLRSQIKVDGFGLKYLPIIDPASTFVNRKPITPTTPDLDCRNAPRSLGAGTTDFYPDAGACEYTHLRVTNTASSSGTPNSLSWALNPAQRIDPFHYVEFDISGAVDPISPTMELELEDAPYFIDGFSQPNSSIPGPPSEDMIALTPAILPIDIQNTTTLGYGIRTAPGAETSIIQGVRIRSFESSGIHIDCNQINVLGCEIGLDNTGTASSNLKSGIRMDGNANQIGGIQHFQRNVISGNGLGVEIEQANITIASRNNQVIGNIIGGANDGITSITAIELTKNGIYIENSNNQIGSENSNGQNIIVNSDFGIYITEDADMTLIKNNLVGIGWDNASVLGNTTAGIFIDKSSDNQIGGFLSSTSNTIANNEIGIVINGETDAAIGNLIVGNSIYNNVGQGIDLENDNLVLPNDGLMLPGSQNLGIDFPELLKSESCDSIETVTTFQLSVPVGEAYFVEFFEVSTPDPTNGEGEIVIGNTTVTPVANPQTFTFAHGELITPGTILTATVTQLSSNNTSEFGTNVEAKIISGDPSISYADICPGAIALPTFEGDTGGTFRFMSPEPEADEVIDDATGEVTNGVEGNTYTIIYGFPVCTNEDTTTFTVNIVEEEFTFDDFCVVGDEAGSLPVPADEDHAYFMLIDAFDGATINPTTGLISNPVEGNSYTIVDSVNVDGCWQADTTTVTAILVDESFEFDPICLGETGLPYDIATPDGTFSFSSEPGDGASITTDGELTDGQPYATYPVKYVVSVDGCTDSLEKLIEIITPNAHFTFDDFCPGPSSPAPIPEVEGGVFAFEVLPEYDESITADEGVITNPVEGEIYHVSYTATLDGCSYTESEEITAILVDEDFDFDDFCVIGDEAGSLPVPNDEDNSYFILIGADDGATIDAATGLISNPIEGHEYTVVDSVFTDGCWQADTAIVLAILVDETFEFDPICFGEIGIPYDIATPGGTFSFSTDPADGATLSVEGELSNGQPDAIYTVKYVVSVDGCSDSLERFVEIITPNATFIFEDFCPAATSPSPIPEVGGGEFSFGLAPAYDESIDLLDGIITNPVEGEEYLVVYTASLDGCEYSDTVEVAAIFVDESFTLNDFCWTTDSEPALPVTDGGEFSFTIPLPPDASIDPISGVISGANEGVSYNVIYTVTVDGCTQSDTIEVLAIGVDESFSFEDFCPSIESPAPIPALPGGIFDFGTDPFDEATINPTSGVITSPTEGATYNITYTIIDETGECSETSTESVSVIAVDESFNFDNFCAEFAGYPSDIATLGGNFVLNDPIVGDAIIDPVTGVLSEAEPLNYYSVSYTVGACSEQDTILVFAMGSDTASFSMDNFCANIDTYPVIDGTTGGSFDLFPEMPGISVDEETGLVDSEFGEIVDLRYITEGTELTCADTIIQTVTIYDVPEIITINSPQSIYCPGESLMGMTISESNFVDKAYWYLEYPDGIVLDSILSYTPDTLLLGNNTFYVIPKSINGCYGDLQEVTLFLSDTAGMRAGPDQEICLGSPAYLQAFGGSAYQWITDVPLNDNTSPIQTAFSLNEQNYVVQILNEEACAVYDTVQVKFLDQSFCSIEIYNAYSPNNDGKNDFWYIDHLINFMPNQVYIYNRWGNQVNYFENYDNINTYWNGTDSNGQDLAPDTYYFVVITEDESLNQAGWVQIVR